MGLLGAALLAPAALAHPERQAFFPDGSQGAVPKYRSKGGQQLVVCKRNSAKRIRKIFAGKRERNRLRLVRKCRFRHVQQAVNAASNNARIKILPGVYRERPSRRAPEPDPRCGEHYDEIGGGIGGTTETKARVANYEYQRQCPNAQNLIAIIGDSDDPDRVCDIKCNIQIEGMGKRRRHVLISGQRSKLNVIRADRADGIFMRNFTVEFSDFNNIYVLETNGFAIKRIKSRYSREYGVPHVHLGPRPLPPTSRRSARATPASTRARAPRATARATGSRSAAATRTTTRSATRARRATASGRTTTASTTTPPA